MKAHEAVLVIVAFLTPGKPESSLNRLSQLS